VRGQEETGPCFNRITGACGSQVPHSLRFCQPAFAACGFALAGRARSRRGKGRPVLWKSARVARTLRPARNAKSAESRVFRWQTRSRAACSCVRC